MGTHLPQNDIIFRTFLFICFLSVSFSQRDENSPGNNVEHENLFDAKMQELLISNSKSESGCNMHLAKMCFNQMANATMDAILKEDGREHKCKEAERMSSCIEYSLSDCPSEFSWPGLAVLHPYVSLLKTIKSTICSEGYQPEDEDAYKHCNVDTVSKCIMGFVYVASDASSVATCWQAKHTRTCLSTATKHCKSRQVKSLVSMVSAMLTQTAQELCKEPGCHVSMATECLHMSKAILLSPIGSVQKSPVLCGAMMAMLSCVRGNTMNCGEDVYSDLGRYIAHLHEVVAQVCENNTMFNTITDPGVGQYASYYAVTKNPFATKETVCPYFHAAVYKALGMIKEKEGNQDDLWYTMGMVSHIARGVCHNDSVCDKRDARMMMHSTCDPMMAKACIKYGDIMSMINNVDILGWDTICHETLRMAECVHYSVSHCKNMSLPMETERTIHQILGMVASHCPIEPILTKLDCLQPKCEIHEALEHCFVMPNMTILAAGHACMMVNQTMHCIHEKTAGCTWSPSLLPVKYAAKSYLDMMRPYCFTPAESHDGDDVVQRVTRCTFNFMDSFQHVMTSATNFSSAMCHIFSKVDKECNRMDDMPTILLPGWKWQGMIWEEIIVKHCSKMEENAGMCPKIPDGRVGTCDEKCSADRKCPDKKICCSNGCGHDCMDPVKDDSDRYMMSTIKEPETCDVYTSAGYLSNYWLQLMQAVFTPITDQHALCRTKEWLGEALKSLLVNCSPEREKVFMDSWAMVEAVHKHICPIDMSGMMPDMMMEKTEDRMCQIEAASKCLEELEGTLIMSSPYYANDTCMQLHHTMKCLHHNLNGCSHDAPELAAIKEKMPYIKTMIGNDCYEYFYGPEMCGMDDSVVSMLMNKMECDKPSADMCVNYFDSAKPMLEQHPEELCRAVMGAKMCVYAKTNNCSNHDNISGSKNLTEVMNYLMASCPRILKMWEEKMEAERRNKMADEKKCYLLQPVAPCTMSVEACFNGSMKPSDVCRNSAAIKACISLATVGCDHMTFTNMYDYLAKETSELGCDILPATPKNYKRPNMTFPFECLANLTDVDNFLKDKKQGDPNDHICEAMPQKIRCLEEKSMNLPSALKMVAHKMASAFKQQIFFKCKTTDKLLDNMDKMNDTETGTCSIDTIAACIYGNSDGNTFGLTSTISDRNTLCSYRKDTIMCIKEAGSGCSEMVKAKILTLLEWNEGIMMSLGVCSEEMPKHCDVKGAMDCVSQLASGHLMATGTEMEPAICAAIAPVEKCVVDKTSTCSPIKRMIVENTLIQVTSTARAMCENMEHKMKDEDDMMRGDCNTDKVYMCASQILNRTSTLLQGHGDKHHICGKMEKLGECVMKHSVKCPGEEGRMIEAHKPLFKLLLEGACSKEKEAQTKEGSHCMMMAGACLTQYLYLAIDSYTGMCSQAVPTLACLKTAVDICPSSQRYVVAMATKHLARVSMESCGSRGCNPEMAYRCLSDADKYIKAAGSKLLHNSMTCGALMPSLVCAMNHTMNCKKEDNTHLHKSIYGLKMVLYDMCPKGKINVALGAGENMTGVEALLPLAILIGSQHVTKEMLCPQVKIAMMRYKESSMHMSLAQNTETRINSYVVEKVIGTYCHEDRMPMKESKTQTCNVSMVMECARSADIPYKISASSLYGWEPVCEAAQKVLCCIHEMSSACIDHNDIYATMQLGVDITAMVKDHCPMEEMAHHVTSMCTLPPAPCNTHQALAECYVPITSRDNITGLCRNLTEIEKCFHRNIKGCMSMQMVPLGHIIKSYRSMCGVSNDITSMIPHDHIRTLSMCYMNYMDELSSSLRSTRAPFKASCMASKKEGECIAKSGVMPPPMLMYLSMASNDMYEEFNRKFCNRSEDTNPLIGEPFACMSEVAEMCVTTYYSRLQTWTTIPVGDREDACGELLEVESCVSNALKSCSPERQQMYKSFMEMIYFYHDKVCPTVPRQHLLLYKDSVCYRDTAEMCVEAFGRHLAMQNGHNKQETCKHFHSMMQCVTYSTRNCTLTTDDKNMIMNVMETAHSIMGNTCPLLSTMVCNSQYWDSILHMATCDLKAAEECMMDFSKALPENMDNDTAICSMYKKSMECAGLHTLLCDHDKVASLNQTGHVVMATYGAHCVEMYGESSEMKCMMRESCSLWIENCFPEETDKICRNIDDIEKCLMKQEEGCQENYKIERRNLIRTHLMMNNVSCDIMSVMSKPATYAATSLGECYLMLQNLTGQFLAEDFPSDLDVCYGLQAYAECIEDGTKSFDPLWKGLWFQIMNRMQDATEIKCRYYDLLRRKMEEDDDDDDDSSTSSDEDNSSSSDESNSSSDEDDSDKDDMGRKMNSTDMDMTRWNYTEPEDCNIKAAGMCMFQYIAMTTHAAFIPIKDRPGTCWYKREMMLPCVMKNTYTCSSRVRRKFVKLYEVTRRMELSIGQCPDMEKEMETKEEKSNMNECHIEEAASCMGMLSGAIIGNAGMKSHTMICSSILPVYSCVMKYTWGCEKHKVEPIERVWNDLYTVAMATCTMGVYEEPKKMMECNDMAMDMDKKKGTCDIPHAMTCLTAWHTKLMKTDEDICSNVPSLRSCIVKHISGCEETHRQAVEGMFAGIHKRIAERCPHVKCDLCGAAHCMKELNTTKKDMTCFDGWKAKQCVMHHIESCSEEEKRHVRTKMAAKFANIPQVCKDEKTLDMCALEFKDIVKKLLNIKLDLNWGMEEDKSNMKDDMKDDDSRDDSSSADDDKKSDRSLMKDQSMDKNAMANDTMKTKLNLETIVKHLLSSNSTCPAALMAEDKMALCKRAALAWKCVEMLIKNMPSNVQELAMGTMKMVKMAVEEKCHEEELTCFKCRATKSNEECNMQPQERCDKDSNMCYTMVDNGLISKGCAPRIPFVEHRQCVDNGTKCVYLCNKNDCNMKTHEGIMDPPSCSRKKAVACGIHMMHSMATSGKPDCSALMQGLMCMYQHSSECLSHTDSEISKHAAGLFYTPMMLKCQVKPHDCNCGRCIVIGLGKMLKNPFASMGDICRVALHAQKEIVGAMMHDQCSMNDLKELTASIRMAKSVLGDTCDSGVVKMSPVRYSETCDLDKAAMCLRSVNISYMVEHSDKIGQHTVCSTVYKMIGCVRHSAKTCDHMSAARRLNETIHKTFSMVSRICNLTLAGELLSPEVRTEEKNMELLEHLEKAIGDSPEMLMGKMGVINEVMRTGVRSNVSLCKPSLAMTYCHWEMMTTPGNNPNFCSVAQRAWDCQSLLIRECLPIQAVPVYHSFFTFVAKDTRMCGYNPKPTKEEVKMLTSIPTYPLSMCVGDYITHLHMIYTNPTTNSTMTICRAAIDLNNCLFHQTDMSAFGKVSLNYMNRMTSELMRVSCMAVEEDMSMVNCSKDDVLCHVMRNMTRNMDAVVQVARVEPDTCMTDLASFCISNYVTRMIVSPFAPMHDNELTCRDLEKVKICMEGTVRTCSEPRRQMFEMAAEWIHNMTHPVCSTKFHLSPPTCHKARQCIEKFGISSMRNEKSIGEFCRSLDMTLQCVEQHAFNCTTNELSYIQKSMYIMGNMSHEYCPAQSETICALSALEARDVTKTCDEVSLGNCVQTFYDTTFERKMTDAQYCSQLMTTTKCMFDNTKNCDVHKIQDYSELLSPGLRFHDVNCTDATAYVLQRMPRCEVKQCKMSDIMYGLRSLKENVTMMIENRKSSPEICIYVSTTIKEHANMMAGCNSLQLYLINFIKNKMLDDYLSQCSGGVDIPVPNDDAVAPMTKCFMELDTDMAAALKTPKYGFADICQATYKMHKCMDAAFITDNNPAMDMVMLHMNDTRNTIIDFLRSDCSGFNTSMLVDVSLPAESRECKVDTAINCVKLLTIKIMAHSMLSEDPRMICSDAERVKRCVDESMAKCSNTLKWQVMTMEKLNMMVIDDFCKFDMEVKNQVEKARVMYAALIDFMINDGKEGMSMDGRERTAERGNDDMEDRRNMMGDGNEDRNDMNGDRNMMGDENGDRNMMGDENGDRNMMGDENGDRNMMGDGKDDRNMMGDEDNDRKMMDHEKCNLYKANECLMTLMTNFDMMARRVCHSNSEYLLTCVRPHVEGCDEMTKYMIYDSMSGPITTIIKKSCMAYKMWAEYLGEGDEGQDRMENDRNEMRNAFDNKEKRMEMEEMKEKRQAEVEKIFKQMNKVRLFVNFVRAADNPLEKDNSESADIVAMIQKIYKMSSNMTDCIESDAFEDQGACYPSAALECARQVDVEMKSLWTTKSRICTKYAIAVRCAMMTSQGCDHATTETLHMRFHEVMGHVGNMCPTVIRNSCKVETQCKVKEVPSCLMPLHKKIMASLQLPTSSTGQLCGYIKLAKECIYKKVEHCPEKVMYQLHELLRPVLGMLGSMCHHLPAEACFTSLLWNMGSVMLLDSNIRMTGSLHTTLKLAEKYNMTLNMTKMMPKEDPPVNVSDSYLQGVTLIHNMMMSDKERECKLSELMGRDNKMEDSDKDKMEDSDRDDMGDSDRDEMGDSDRDDMGDSDRDEMGDSEMEKMKEMRDSDKGEMDGSLMSSLLHMVKFVMMNEKMIEKDEQFIKMARVSMLNLQKDQSMQDFLDLVTHITKKIHEHVDDKDMRKMNITSANLILKIIVGLGNGHEIVTSAYHTMAYLKIGHMMDKINELVIDESGRGQWADRWDYLNMGLLKSIKEGMQKELTKAAMGMIELHMKPNDTRKLEGVMTLMKTKKLQTCTGLIDVAHCAMEHMASLPKDKRQLMNITLQSVTGVATALCHNIQCHSCSGAKDNMECNRNTPQSCDVAQSCYTMTDKGLIYKGCGYHVGKEFGNKMFCEGSMCNRNQYTVDIDIHDDCKPMEALMCLSNLIPIIAMDGEVNQRLIYKNLHCIEQHVASCRTPHTRIMGDLVPWIKHGLEESTCSGEEAGYECGMRSILGLAVTVMNPAMPRMTVCSQLNDTYRLLEWATHHNKCSDYEKMAAYKGIKSIHQIIGPDYCPGVYPKREAFCNDNMTRTNVCNKTAATYCMAKHNVMDMMKDMKMSHEANEHFCWGLTELLVCIGNYTSGCGMSEDLSDLQHMFKERIGRAISHCPVLEMTLSICHPELLVTDTVCKPALVPTHCFDLAKDGCNALDDEKIMEGTLKCIDSLTNGCSHIQQLSVYHTVHAHMSEYLISCGNDTVRNMLEKKIATRKAMPVDMTIARLVAFVQSMSLATTLDNTDGSTPVMNLLHKVVEARMKMTGMMESSLNNMSSGVFMKAKEVLHEMKEKRSVIQDDTMEITKCALQFDTEMTVAMTFPELFDVLYCEALTTFVSCMGHHDIQAVPKMYAYTIRDTFAGYQEIVCANYLDEIAGVGMTISSVLGNQKNMSQMNMTDISGDRWTQLLGHLTKDDNQCDTFGIASILAGIITHFTTGPFKNSETYSMMCQALHYADSWIAPMTDKCSAEHKTLYHSIVYYMKQEAASTCYNPVLNSTVPDTCQEEMAGYCLASVMPLLSSQATPDWQLCMHLSMAVQCVGFQVEHCSGQTQAHIYGTLSYLQSIAGNRCPLLTAFMQCSEAVPATATTTCSLKGVKQCVANITSCSDIPKTMTCVTRHSMGCSAYQLHNIHQYMDMTWMEILRHCPEKDIIAQLYSQGTCQAPPTCSLAEAYNCSHLATSGDCSTISSVQSCFESKTRGCNNIQYLMARTTLAFYYRKNYPLCVTTLLTIPTAVGNVTRFNKMYMCVNTYVMDAPVAMNTSTPSKKGCDAFMTLMKCLGDDMTDIESYWSTLFAGNSFNISIEIMYRYCALEMPENEMMVDKDDKCDRGMAYECLTVAGLHSMFSSVMAQGDKKAFCSKSMSLMVDCATTEKNCWETSSNSIRGAHAMIESVKWLSGSCADELWVCAPEDAVFCSSGMSEKMAEMSTKMMAMNRTESKNKTTMMEAYHREMCRMYDESMSCVKRLTFGCSKEVNDAVKQSLMTSLCFSYDIVKECPSEKEMVSIAIPQCHDNHNRMDKKKEMTDSDKDSGNSRTKRAVDSDKMNAMADEDKDTGCSLVAVNTCVGLMYTELYTATLDCSRFHRTYLKTMKCVHENSISCSTENPAVGRLVKAIANLTVTSVWSKCPNVVMEPCRESDSCGIEQAGVCFEKFKKHYETAAIDGPELCLSSEVAKYCNMEHTKECSVFSQYYFPNMIDGLLKTRKVTCEPSAATCLHKFMITTVGILHGDLTMASIMRKQQEMTFDIPDLMMNQMKMNNMMDNATRKMASSEKMVKEAMSNFSDLSHFLDAKTMQMLHDHVEILYGLSDSDDQGAVYMKVKMVQCVGLHEAWSCLMETGDKAGLSMEAVHVLNATLGRMFEMTNKMCNKASVLSLVEEPASCHILPAALTFMNHITRLTIPVYGKEWFCTPADLTKAIDQVKDYTVSCSSDIQTMFDGLNSQIKIARDTLCRAKPVCNQTLVMECINQYKSQMDCGSYETAHSCVELHVMGCDQATADNFRNLLKTASASSCEKFPKFKVTQSPLRLLEGGSPVELEISVEEDASVWCSAGTSCSLQFDLDIDDGSEKCKDGTTIPQIVVTEENGVCQRVITNQNWAVPVSYTLTARSDGKYDGTHNINVNVTAHKFVDGTKVLTRVISRIQAVVVDTDQTAMCTSMGGSRMSSFDGLYQNIGYQGEFVAYKHTQYPQEVHTMYQKCSSGASNLCICAVMIKVGDDSLTIDKCRRSGGSDVVVPTVTFYKVGDLTTGLKIFVDRGGRDIKVLLPTGTVVGVDVSSMTLWIIPSSLDWLRSEGLCGVYDANMYNDARSKDGTLLSLVDNIAPRSLASSWRVQAFESIFTGSFSAAPNVWNNYCTCSSQATSGTCHTMMITESCDLVSGEDITSTLLGLASNPSNTGGRRKRATNDPISGLDVDYTFVAPDVPWPSNWNETTARAFCENYLLQSDLGQKCMAATGYDFETEVLACIYSIKENGNTLLTSSAMESMKIKCVTEIDKNLPSLAGDAALVADILSQTCPNDCSGNGQCVNGACNCLSTHEQTADCSILKGTQPTLFSLRDDNLCELSDTNSCTEVFVTGQHFLESNTDRTLSCHFESTGVAMVTVPAQYITSTMVRCTGIPSTTSHKTWTITVTNKADRQVATSTLGYTVYHPSCYVCTDYQNCVSPNNPTGCLISSTCYESSAINPSNTCQRCIPEISASDWTHVIGGSCVGYLSTQSPPATSPTNGGQTNSPSGNNGNTTPSTSSSDDDTNRVVLIVLGCLAGGFALTSIILACKVCHAKEKDIKRQSSDYSPSASDSASNKEYDNVHAFDNIGYSYSGTAQPSYKSQGATPQKQLPVEELTPPTKIVVDEERKFDNESLTNSGSKYGNDDYAFVDPAKKRVDRLDQAFSPQDGTQPPQDGTQPPQNGTQPPQDSGQVKKEENASVNEVKSVNAKDISIDIDSNNL